MKYLFYCNSAYQLINAINLHWHMIETCEKTNYQGDLLILNVFSGAEEIYSKLKENEIFSNISIAKRPKYNSMFISLEVLLGIINPKYFISITGCTGIDSFEDKYDYIVTTKFSKLPAAIWQINRNAKIILYEDGLATYSNNVSLSPNSGMYKMFYKLFNHNRSFDMYECLYLNYPEMYIGNMDKVKSMPRLNDNQINVLKSYFCNNQMDDNKQIYWFGQYIGKEVSQMICDSLQKYANYVLYKPHPRYPFYYDAFATEENGIWELDILNISDIEKKYLITIHSTAVFTPKILYDKEPYIILAYRLLKDYDSKIESSIQKFVNSYSSKEKIMIPNTFEELTQNIDSCLEGNITV